MRGIELGTANYESPCSHMEPYVISNGGHDFVSYDTGGQEFL